MKISKINDNPRKETAIIVTASKPVEAAIGAAAAVLNAPENGVVITAADKTPRVILESFLIFNALFNVSANARITSYNVCYTKLLRISDIGVWGVKFHLLHIIKDTSLYEYYQNSPFKLPEMA